MLPGRVKLSAFLLAEPQSKIVAKRIQAPIQYRIRNTIEAAILVQIVLSVGFRPGFPLLFAIRLFEW